MKNSISKKISKITFGLILGVFFLTLLFQSLFFEDFYISKKTDSLINNVRTFKTMYSYQIHNKVSLGNALRSYEESNNCRIAIFSLDGQRVYMTDYQDDSNDLRTLTDFCQELLNDKELIQGVLNSNIIKSSIFTNKSSGTKKIGIVAPMSLQSENDSIIISVSSIQPIKEASSVIKSFYFYLFIGFVIVAIFLSKIYSHLISNPLVKINNIAKKMSHLDFEAKCEVTSQDEIGNLANTLNFLSLNLKESLDDLKEKNYQLELEIEKERKLENMRKDFVTSVSHDLKTPLGIIGGYAEGLKDGIVSGEDSKLYLETIIDEVSKMNLLLTSMLDLSKLESGTISLNAVDFNIVRLLQGIIKRFSLELQTKNLQVIFTEIPEFAYVNGDILKIEQVVQNLIANALKYTPSDNTIEVSVTDKIDKFEISIINTGITIPPDELENIFVKFYRLDKSGNRTENNFGLGLAIVKSILDLHNSTYSISNLENAVSFKFTLNKKKEHISDN